MSAGKRHRRHLFTAAVMLFGDGPADEMWRTAASLSPTAGRRVEITAPFGVDVGGRIVLIRRAGFIDSGFEIGRFFDQGCRELGICS